MTKQPLHLFEGHGIELEYMIVDSSHLSVLPASDQVLFSVAGSYESEVEMGELSWSNELVLHVIELKTNGPAASLAPLPALFTRDVRRINSILEPLGAMLMPGAMHPWMDPVLETKLWPHEYSPVYEAYDRIFGCQGHGWSNLQSLHINLPFYDDEEFSKLHAAIRFVLPILPALAASSPIIEGHPTGLMDSRLDVYRSNSARLPFVTGNVIPEPVYTKAGYEKQILERMYEDIRPLDPEGTLQHEFLNSRGAIARFERNTIEIRVLDVQETPLVDLAIASAIVELVRAIIGERWTGIAELMQFPTQPLAQLFLSTVRDAEAAVIHDRLYLEMLGYPHPAASARDLWHHIIEELITDPWKAPLDAVLANGPLARRILRALKSDYRRDALSSVYRELCDCLNQGKLFLP